MDIHALSIWFLWKGEWEYNKGESNRGIMQLNIGKHGHFLQKMNLHPHPNKIEIRSM